MHMGCKQCSTHGRKDFTSEIAIHFPGLGGLHKPIVWVFPELLVCLSCGFTEFQLPEKELSVLIQGNAVEGANVLDECE
jgi:hypothetical protein